MRQTILFFLLFTVGLFADELAAKDSTVNTPQNIEQAILAEPLPASEMVRRGRAYLLKSLLNGDREQAVQTIEYLNSAFSEMLCPFSGMEKGLAYLHADRYDSALTALIQARRLSAPKAKRAVSFEDRCVVESQNDRFRSKRIIFDELYAYLEKDYPKTAAQIDSLVSEIQILLWILFIKMKPGLLFL